jgi:hypothetical protein
MLSCKEILQIKKYLTNLFGPWTYLILNHLNSTRFTAILNARIATSSLGSTSAFAVSLELNQIKPNWFTNVIWIIYIYITFSSCLVVKNYSPLLRRQICQFLSVPIHTFLYIRNIFSILLQCTSFLLRFLSPLCYMFRCIIHHLQIRDFNYWFVRFLTLK